MNTTFDAVPELLLGSHRWLVWNLETRKGKPTKVPYMPTAPTCKAAVDDPSTWGPFPDALACVLDGKAAGPGFVLGDDVTGVDLDHCRDPQSGTIEPWAWTIIRDLDSYTEISPSGTGVHILARGKLPPGRRKKGAIEMYAEGKYFTVTGQHLAGTPATLNERTTELAALHQATFPPEAGPGALSNHAAVQPHDLDDDALLEQARQARNGPKFNALWQGDPTGYASASEGDLALCRQLAFWTDADAGRMDRLFRRSDRMRPKWDERHGASTYGEQTIAKAVASCGETYGQRASAAPMRTPAATASTRASAPSTPILPAGLQFPDAHPTIFHGLPGEIVASLRPYTEGSAIGLLTQLLAGIGSLIGRKGQAAHVCVDGSKPEYLNLYLLIIGDTGEARKQTSWALIHRLLTQTDPTWRTTSGLVSGEGLISALRDGSEVRRGTKFIDVDEGVEDKRMLAIEEEFSQILTKGRRDGSTLLEALREFWDQDVVRTRGKREPATATHPHLSLIGHITPQILARRMLSEDFNSGFANRFLHIAVRGSQVLTDPQPIPEPLSSASVAKLTAAVAYGQQCGVLRRDPDAQARWTTMYPDELRQRRRGLMAALCTRAPSHVMHLAALYAVCDAAPAIGVAHLEAGHALWQYAEATLAWVYGVSITGSDSADALLRALRQAGEAGVPKTEMYGMRLARDAASLDRDLDLLATLGLAAGVLEATGPRGGRPVERWRARRPAG